MDWAKGIVGMVANEGQIVNLPGGAKCAVGKAREGPSFIDELEMLRSSDIKWQQIEDYSLVNVNKKLWKDPPFSSWENPRTKWQCSIVMLVYQRIKSTDSITFQRNI